MGLVDANVHNNVHSLRIGGEASASPLRALSGIRCHKRDTQRGPSSNRAGRYGDFRLGVSPPLEKGLGSIPVTIFLNVFLR